MLDILQDSTVFYTGALMQLDPLCSTVPLFNPPDVLITHSVQTLVLSSP